MIIENDSERAALRLTNRVYLRDTQWAIILPDFGRPPEFGNNGNWFSDADEAEAFDTMEDAQAHLTKYGQGAVVAFIERNITIHY